MNILKASSLGTLFVLSLFLISQISSVDFTNTYVANDRNNENLTKVFDKDAPEQVVFEYVKLVKLNSLQELTSLYTRTPNEYIQVSKKENKDLTFPLPSKKEGYITKSSITDSPSQDTAKLVLDDLSYDFFIRYAPNFINAENLDIERAVPIQINQEFCQIRVNYASGKKTTIYKHDFFLYKNNGIWKIFKIEFPQSL